MREDVKSRHRFLHGLGPAQFAHRPQYLCHLVFYHVLILGPQNDVDRALVDALPIANHLVQQGFQVVELGRTFNVANPRAFPERHGVGDSPLGLQGIHFLHLVRNVDRYKEPRIKRQSLQHTRHSTPSLFGQDL